MLTKQTAMLEREFNFYLKHQNDLIKKYKGKFLVIVGDEVVAAYETRSQAYDDSLKKYKLGTFLIQYCSEGDSGYTQTFHTHRVAFS